MPLLLLLTVVLLVPAAYGVYVLYRAAANAAPLQGASVLDSLSAEEREAMDTTTDPSHKQGQSVTPPQSDAERAAQRAALKSKNEKVSVGIAAWLKKCKELGLVGSNNVGWDYLYRGDKAGNSYIYKRDGKLTDWARGMAHYPDTQAVVERAAQLGVNFDCWANLTAQLAANTTLTEAKKKQAALDPYYFRPNYCGPASGASSPHTLFTQDDD